MKKPAKYTKEELEYGSKSWKANLTGGFLSGFSQAGFLRVIKNPSGTRPLLKLTKSKLGSAIALAGSAASFSSLYFDVKAIKASKNKSRAIINSLYRNFAGGFAGGFAGAGVGAGLRFGVIPKARGFIKTKMASETVRFYKATPANKAAGLGQMMKDKIIKFVRIRGRIVPIRAAKSKTVNIGPKLLSAPKGS